MDIEKLADEIVKALFINGAGQEAKRLVLELPNGKDGGGWSQAGARGAIAAQLRVQLTGGILPASEPLSPPTTGTGIEYLKHSPTSN